MIKNLILSLALLSFVLCACEEALEAIEALDGPANCEASIDPINEINDTADYWIAGIETGDFTDEEKATKIEDINNGRQELIDAANSEHCR